MERLIVPFLLLSGILLHAQPVFEHQVIDANISIGYGLAIGDVDGDKRPDILLAEKKQIVWYRNGDWKRFILTEDLTQSDNVCIAARDIDGDGMVEIAVGAQWNPGETSDTARSGSVHFLMRPEDPTHRWKPIKLHHEPTVHRMKWVMIAPNEFVLVVVPLHGVGNTSGEGTPVKVLAYRKPKDLNGKWTHETVDQSMHLTHNLEVMPSANREVIGIAGKEGMKVFAYADKKWSLIDEISKYSLGEVRSGGKMSGMITTIEPMHGNKVTCYLNSRRTVLDSTLNQGHALACADVLGKGSAQIIAGWREKDATGKTGIKLYEKTDENWTTWRTHIVDDKGMACEDLVVADLNGDTKPDIIAAGRASRNLKVYWNKSK